MNYLRNHNFNADHKKSDLPLYLFLLIGSAFRLFHFFYNRSLWMDEVYLSESLVKMNYLQLVSTPLYYQQKAPLGFLMLVKFIINLFGTKEIYLRLIPLLSGIASMYFFIPISKYFLNRWGAYLAMAILSFSPALVYHSVEIKQYSTELFGTILCFSIYIRYKTKNNLWAMLKWGIIGAIILWFSYSSIFILAGIALGVSIQHLINKKWKAFLINSIPFFIWLLSFCINYIFFTHKHAESEWITYWFRSYENFMPFPPKSISDFIWFPKNLYRMMDYPLGLLWNFTSLNNNQPLSILLKMPFIGITLLLTGIFVLFRYLKDYSFILLPPILLTLIASGLELYPLTERFWVFISPIFIIFIAFGFQYLVGNIRSGWLRLMALLFVIAGPLVQSVSFIVKPENFYANKKSFQREALMYVNEHMKPGDTVYIYWNNLPGYKLYKEIYHFNFSAIEGRDLRNISTDFNSYYNNLKLDFDRLKASKRVWLVYNTQFLTDIGDKIDEPTWYYKKGISPTAELLKKFNNFGTTISTYKTGDIAIYLFDINNNHKQKL